MSTTTWWKVVCTGHMLNWIPSFLQVHPYTYRNENQFLHFDFHQDPYAEYDFWINKMGVDGLFTDFAGSVHQYQELKSPHPKDATANSLLVKIAQLIAAYEGHWISLCSSESLPFSVINAQDQDELTFDDPRWPGKVTNRCWFTLLYSVNTSLCIPLHWTPESRGGDLYYRNNHFFPKGFHTKL